MMVICCKFGKVKTWLPVSEWLGHFTDLQDPLWEQLESTALTSLAGGVVQDPGDPGLPLSSSQVSGCLSWADQWGKLHGGVGYSLSGRMVPPAGSPSPCSSWPHPASPLSPQGSRRGHTDSQSSLRSSCSSQASLSPRPSSPFSTLPPTSPHTPAGEVVTSHR